MGVARISSMEQVDVLVVGSGFGGSVAAYRLAEGGRSVVLFERGKRYAPGDFARTPEEMGRNFWDPSAGMYGLFDAWNFRGTEGLVSSGLGGGSLIYANVLLRKDPEWFVHDSPIPGGGYENWPFSREDLDPHYDRVEQMLKPAPYPYTETPKTRAMRDSARDLGLDIQLPPLAVVFSPTPGAPPAPRQPIPPPEYGNVHDAHRETCSLCGECDLGCNVGAKNTLDHTYLSAAAHHGADIRELHEVRGLRPLESGFEVRYVIHADDGHGVPTRDLPVRILRCRRLILAGGTFGTTFLLLRSRASLPGLSPKLGSRYSGNGDLLTVLLGARTPDGAPRRLRGSTGPVITSAIRVPDGADNRGGGRGYYVEDAGYPAFLDWLIEASRLRSVAMRSMRLVQRLVIDTLTHGDHSNVSADMAAALGNGQLSSTSLPLLGMGRDVPDGVMTLKHGRLALDWTTTTSMAYFAAMRATMQRLADHLGGRLEDDPLWWANRVITVHPLGGAPVGRHPQEGVCDPFGEVFGFPGLHVFDGAAMPGPVGANPSLTIAAMADRGCDAILERPRSRQFASPPSAAASAGPATD